MRSIISFFCLIASICANAQSAKLENTVLWEISGGGWSRPSYLFGTMHLLCEQDAKLSDSLRFAIDRSDKIYFELDMDNMLEMVGMVKHMKMRDDVKLKDLLTDAEYNRLKAYFDTHKTVLSFNMIERYKPFFISALLQQQGMPCEAKDGMESVIMKYAKRQRKEIKGLETMAFQASIFDSIPYQDQARELIRFVDSADTQRDKMKELMDVYLEQDLDKMMQMTMTEDMGMPNALDLLLFQRNARWVQSMQQISGTETLIYAVGAGHLPGDKGVIQLLRDAGFRVRPMLHEVRKGTLAAINTDPSLTN
jgi:uncharacterized protein YbaP (TraB family)